MGNICDPASEWRGHFLLYSSPAFSLPASKLPAGRSLMHTPDQTRAYSPSAENLRNLLIIRSIALLGQTGVLAFVVYNSRTTADMLGVIVSLVLLAVVTAGSLWRTTRSAPVTDAEFLTQLLIDVVGWTFLMYFTGGANNPFISYYIVPLVIAAAVLPWRFTWLIAGASMLAYSLLLYVYIPFPLFTPHAGMHHGEGTNIHILGMWFNFLFSAALITYFVVRMAAILRRQEAAAVKRREDRLRNDQIMAVASLAAGTAHELGTPLGTMAVLIEELLADDTLSSQSRRDCELIRDKVAECKKTLTALSHTAEAGSTKDVAICPVGDFAQNVLEQWTVRRPGVCYRFECKPGSPAIECDVTLAQALENLLNNAADTGSADITLSVQWDHAQARMSIRDHGPGLTASVMENLGKPVLHADRNGLGIGLMLSQAAVERFGGHIKQLRQRVTTEP